MAISDYLKAIENQRDRLKTNLKSRDVFVGDCNTFNKLIPKVLEIKGGVEKNGAQNGVWTPTATTDKFSLFGLPFIPSKLAICCESVFTTNYTAVTDHINIALLNIEFTSDEISMLKQGAGGNIEIQVSGAAADIIFEEVEGLYNVTVSFSETNKTLTMPYKFKANASHVWCIAEEGWMV